METTDEIYYRFEDLSGHVVLRTFKVIKHTPKGVWIDKTAGDKRFVKLDAKKMYACPTIADAKKSFKARKKRQIKIYDAKIQLIKLALNDIDMFNETTGRLLDW